MRNGKIGILAALAVGLGLASAAPAAVITNGGFDGYTGAADGNPISSLSPASWVVVGTSSQVLHKTTAAGGALTAQSGTSFLGIFDGGSSNNGVRQTFDTTAGKLYELTFYLARQNGNGPPDIHVDVFDGPAASGLDLTGTVSPFVINWAAGTWQQQTLSFVALSDTTTLRFQENGNSTNVDPFVDSVAVTRVVPAPAALPAGLALLGLAAARRRRSA